MENNEEKEVDPKPVVPPNNELTRTSSSCAGILTVLVISITIFACIVKFGERSFRKEHAAEIRRNTAEKTEYFVMDNDSLKQRNTMVCKYYPGMLNGHDYVVFQSYGHENNSDKQFVHDPDCKKCTQNKQQGANND